MVIAWWLVAANGLWIVGLSIVLAALSYHKWLAYETRLPGREVFRRSSWRLPWTSGMFLTCVGWGLSQAESWWEKAIWLALAAWFARAAILVFVQVRHSATQPLSSRPLDSAGRP